MARNNRGREDKNKIIYDLYLRWMNGERSSIEKEAQKLGISSRTLKRGFVEIRNKMATSYLKFNK